MRVYVFIFLTGFVIGFAIACVNIFSQRNDADNINLFVVKNSSIFFKEKDCKVRLDTGEHQYTYSVSTGIIATDNYTKETKENTIEEIPELYKATGLSTSISVATFAILKNEKAKKYLFDETFSTSSKIKRVVSFVLGIGFGYALGCKLIHPSPAWESPRMVEYLTNKVNWERNIIKYIWKINYEETLYGVDLGSNETKAARRFNSGAIYNSNEFKYCIYSLKRIQREKVQNDVDYKLVSDDFRYLVAAKNCVTKLKGN